MIQILMFTDSPGSPSSVLPALDLLPHAAQVQPTSAALSASGPFQRADLVMIDGRSQLVPARNLAQLLRAKEADKPVLMILTEGGMAAVAATWLVDDIVLATAGPAEVEARIRLACGRRTVSGEESTQTTRVGAIVIDEAAYSAHVGGEALNLTYKEFELLKHLAQNAGRVFTRAQLLAEVWGFDYFGGTRTVDVHIRRLRAKLGPDHEQLITTVRNVGYSLTADRAPRRTARD